MTLYDNKYIFIKDLGNGGFGKVFLAKERVSNRFVAIKQLLTENKFLQENIIHEIETIAKFEEILAINLITVEEPEVKIEPACRNFRQLLMTLS